MSVDFFHHVSAEPSPFTAATEMKYCAFYLIGRIALAVVVPSEAASDASRIACRAATSMAARIGLDKLVLQHDAGATPLSGTILEALVPNAGRHCGRGSCPRSPPDKRRRMRGHRDILDSCQMSTNRRVRLIAE